MADTIQNVSLPANQWTDLYAATGIDVGTAISVENVGTNDIYLTVLPTEPPVGYDAYNIVQRKNGVRLRNTTGDSGSWAYSPSVTGKVNVRPIE